MKKNLLLAAAAAAFLTLSAQTAPTGKWAYMLDGNTTSGDQTSAIATDGNSVYWLATMGSTESANEILYDGEKLFEGENYNSGNSCANNLCLLATDPSGAKQWVIYSNSGDYSNNSGDIAIDGQGNAVFAIKVRHGDSLDAMNFVDAKGTITTFGTATDRRYYGMLIAKADSEGKVLWHKYVSLATTPAPGNESIQDFVADAVNVTSVAIDDDGNIYVGGNYSAEMTVAPGVILPAYNIANAQIDTQNSTGNMFILKYDSDGNYLDYAIGNDGLVHSRIINLEWANNSLYIYGDAYSKDGDKELIFGTKSVTPSIKATPIFGQLDANLSAKWLNKIDVADVAGACVIQNSAISVVGNTLWLAGMFNGKFINPENPEEFIASVGKTPREGCIVKLDANNGKWINATTSRSSEFTPAAAKTGLTGYFKVLQNNQRPDNIYVYGYVMNATVGVVLREYNAYTLEANLDHAWSLLTGGGAPSCTAIAHNPLTNMAYISARGNKAFELIDGITTAAPSGWGNVFAGVEMPSDLLTGVETVGIAPYDTLARYYNLNGMEVNASNLAPGIYIRRLGTSATKFLVK